MIKFYLERNNTVRPLVLTGKLVSGRKHKENIVGRKE